MNDTNEKVVAESADAPELAVINESETRSKVVARVIAQMGRDRQDIGLQDVHVWKELYKPVITEAYLAEKVKAESKGLKTSWFSRGDQKGKKSLPDERLISEGQGFTALSNDPHRSEKIDAINEFCRVLQAALQAARTEADKSSRVHHSNGKYRSLNFFIARECAKALIRSTPAEQEAFFKRWAAAGNNELSNQEVSPRHSVDTASVDQDFAQSLLGHNEPLPQHGKNDEAKSDAAGNVEKSIMAASAVYDIAKTLRKNKIDKRRHNIKTAAHLMVLPAIAEAFLVPAYDDKLTLHPDIRKQFKHDFKLDFISETPPPGFHWNAPEVVEDISTLPKSLELTAARVNNEWVAKLTDTLRTKSKTQGRLMVAWNSINVKAFQSSAISDYIRADITAAQNKLRTDACNWLYLDVGQHIQDFIDNRTEPPKEAYITYEATVEGARRYYRISLKDLFKEDARNTHPILSPRNLQKTVYAAVSTFDTPRSLVGAAQTMDGRYVPMYGKPKEAVFWSDLNRQYQAEKLVDEARVIDLDILRKTQFFSKLTPKTENELEVLSKQLEQQQRDIDEQRKALAAMNKAHPGTVQDLVADALAPFAEMSTTSSASRTSLQQSYLDDESPSDKVKRLEEEYKKAMNAYQSTNPASRSLLTRLGMKEDPNNQLAMNLKRLRDELAEARKVEEARKEAAKGRARDESSRQRSTGKTYRRS